MGASSPAWLSAQLRVLLHLLQLRLSVVAVYSVWCCSQAESSPECRELENQLDVVLQRCSVGSCALQSLGWRTMLVVPELEQELAIRAASKATQRELRMLRIARADLDNQIQRLEWAFKQVWFSCTANDNSTMP